MYRFLRKFKEINGIYQTKCSFFLLPYKSGLISTTIPKTSFLVCWFLSLSDTKRKMFRLQKKQTLARAPKWKPVGWHMGAR